MRDYANENGHVCAQRRADMETGCASWQTHFKACRDVVEGVRKVCGG